MTDSFIALGANLGHPLATLRKTEAALKQQPGVAVTGRSPIYRSAPVGPPGQSDYLNAVLALDVDLGPHELLDCLQALENEAGRVRSVRWGARTLDLDILLFGEVRLEDERLSIPHPQLQQRNFVLQPLMDLCGADWQLPGGSRLGDCLARCPENPLCQLDEGWEAAPAMSAQGTS